MPRYLISFDDGAMDHITAAELPVVGAAAQAHNTHLHRRIFDEPETGLAKHRGATRQTAPHEREPHEREPQEE